MLIAMLITIFLQMLLMNEIHQREVARLFIFSVHRLILIRLKFDSVQLCIIEI